MACVGPAAAQTVVEPASEMSHVLQQLQSPSWRTRSAGFDALVELAIPKDFDLNSYMVPPGLDVLLQRVPERRETITLALIGLLERENRGRHQSAMRNTGTISASWSGRLRHSVISELSPG